MKNYNNNAVGKIVCVGMLPLVGSSTVHAQTLNEVVSEQLSSVAGIPCLNLLGPDDPLAVLTGGLQDICTRLAPVGATPPSASGGGGAATPTNLPKIVRRILEDEEAEEEGGAAGSDRIVELGQSVGLFWSGEYQSLDRDVTTFEDGYDSDIWRFSGGIDYRPHKSVIVGTAFDFRHQEGNFTGSGDFKQNSYGGLIFASLTPIDNLFVQVSGGYAYQFNDRSRFATFSDTTGFSVSGFADSEYEGDEYSAGLLSGYDFSVGNVTFGPRAGLDWVKNNYNAYTETGNSGLELSYARDHRSSLQSRLGLFGSAAFSTGIAVIVPQLGFDWIHEFENDQRDINFSFAGDTRNKTFTFQNEIPDRDFFEVNAGASLVFAHGAQAFINYRALAGHDYFDGHSASIGMRVEF